MKKYALILGFLLCLTACGSSEAVREARKSVNGDWILESVDFPGNNPGLALKLLNDTSAQCFTSSNWTFVSNNNTGSYILDGVGCDGSTRFFTWSVKEASQTQGQYDLLLKPTDSNYKSTTGNQGFRFKLVTLTQTEMVWEQTITFEGEPFTIKMNFTKN